MIRITIAQATAREIKGTSKTTGKPYAFRTQKAYAHTVDLDGNSPPFPEAFEVILDDGQPAYQPGAYTLHPSSLYVDRNGRLQVGARLAPIKA